jgi:hypothetical protein
MLIVELHGRLPAVIIPELQHSGAGPTALNGQPHGVEIISGQIEETAISYRASDLHWLKLPFAAGQSETRHLGGHNGIRDPRATGRIEDGCNYVIFVGPLGNAAVHGPFRAAARRKAFNDLCWDHAEIDRQSTGCLRLVSFRSHSGTDRDQPSSLQNKAERYEQSRNGNPS